MTTRTPLLESTALPHPVALDARELEDDDLAVGVLDERLDEQQPWVDRHLCLLYHQLASVLSPCTQVPTVSLSSLCSRNIDSQLPPPTTHSHHASLSNPRCPSLRLPLLLSSLSNSNTPFPLNLKCQ